MTMAAQYDLHGIGGPNPSDLHFDMQYMPLKKSNWNRKVFSILLTRLKERRQLEQWELPERTDFYYLDIIAERFVRLAQRWHESRPKVSAGGTLETTADVETRVVGKRQKTGQRARQHQRRNYVSFYWSSFLVYSQGQNPPSAYPRPQAPPRPHSDPPLLSSVP